MIAASDSENERRSPGQGIPGRPADPGRLRKRSVVIAGHPTSVSLEDAFWEALSKIARTRRESLGSLITRIDRERSGNLSSAIRVFVLTELESRTAQTGPTPQGCEGHRG